MTVAAQSSVREFNMQALGIHMPSVKVVLARQATQIILQDFLKSSKNWVPGILAFHYPASSQGHMPYALGLLECWPHDCKQV